MRDLADKSETVVRNSSIKIRHSNFELDRINVPYETSFYFRINTVICWIGNQEKKDNILLLLRNSSWSILIEKKNTCKKRGGSEWFTPVWEWFWPKFVFLEYWNVEWRTRVRCRTYFVENKISTNINTGLTVWKSTTAEWLAFFFKPVCFSVIHF